MTRRARVPLAYLSAAALIACGCGGGAAKQTSRHEAVAPPPPPRPPVGSHYSPRLRATMLRSCEAAAAGAAGGHAKCACTLRYLEAHVPQATLEATEKAVVQGQAKEPNWMLNAIFSCQKA